MAQNEQEMERLKQKYQPAINLMHKLQVRLQNMNMEGNKLFIRGEAPSQDAKNQIWNQIKLIDAEYSDLVCDLAVSAHAQPQTMSAGASVAGGQSQRRYVVRPGDTLSRISKEFYGDPNQYMRIFEANRNILKDPNRISAGQELVIPE
jgi:nucleoid-associated protein YgaU